jgi:hypothetical protein
MAISLADSYQDMIEHWKIYAKEVNNETDWIKPTVLGPLQLLNKHRDRVVQQIVMV